MRRAPMALLDGDILGVLGDYYGALEDLSYSMSLVLEGIPRDIDSLLELYAEGGIGAVLDELESALMGVGEVLSSVGEITADLAEYVETLSPEEAAAVEVAIAELEGFADGIGLQALEIENVIDLILVLIGL